jgi:hypothetical protein
VRGRKQAQNAPHERKRKTQRLLFSDQKAILSHVRNRHFAFEENSILLAIVPAELQAGQAEILSRLQRSDRSSSILLCGMQVDRGGKKNLGGRKKKRRTQPTPGEKF